MDNNRISVDGSLLPDELMFHLQFLTEEQREDIFHQMFSNVRQITPFLYKTTIKLPYPIEELQMKVKVSPNCRR